MKSRTTRFVGERLREVRLARGLTGVALAEILGVSRAAVSQYERGDTTPRQELAWQMANRLNVPASYFVRRVERDEGSVYWRSTATSTKSARNRARIRLHWLADMIDYLQQEIRFPETNVPKVELPATPEHYRQETIEDAAETARQQWGLSDGPISNVAWLLENNGIIITLGAYEEPSMDSFCRYGNGDHFPLMCLNRDKASAVRSRFDAAHELGHLILHHRVEKEYWSNRNLIKMREEQAHKFAGAFLLPRNSFADDAFLPSLDSLLSIKSKWKVSVQAMLMRCTALNLLMDDHAARLWRNLARRRWKTREPLDDQLEFENPQLLPKAVSILEEINPIAAVDMIAQLGMSPRDAAELAMVDVSTFERPRNPNITHLYARTAE